MKKFIAVSTIVIAVTLCLGASVASATVTWTPDYHWIKDFRTNVYLWNPEPSGNEYIYWSGSYSATDLEDEYGHAIRFAHGYGTVSWYRDDVLIQVDEGSFWYGRHDGYFTHTFYPSGRVIHSRWDKGTEIE